MTTRSLCAEKRCRKCCAIKPADEFNRRSASPDGLQLCCRACQHSATKAWRAANPDKITGYRARTHDHAVAYAAQYHTRHAERINSRKTEYYRLNPEKQTERSRRQRAKDPAAARLRSCTWQEENKDRARLNVSSWRTDNPEARAAQVHNRRSLALGANGSHTKNQTVSLLISQDHRCGNPHCAIDLRQAKKALDHKIALARGGSNDIENLQWLCVPCNSRKSHLDFDDWLNRESIRAQRRRAA